jgi:putative copper export protein/methionine-rich copper-binding protein CopC
VLTLLVALVALAGLQAAAGPAAAQSETENELVSTEPADGATIGNSPEPLTFTFAQPLGPDDALTAPVACGNEAQGIGIPEVASDRTVVTVDVTRPFPRGACTVSWLLRDGVGETITQGLFTFSVQNAPVATPADTTAPAAAPVAPAPTPTANANAASDDEGSNGGAMWLGRFLSTTAVLALFGAFVLIGAAWPEGPEYVITVRFLRSLWVLALVATVLFVVAFTADVTDTAFGASLNPTAWFDLFDAGWPGRAAILRLVAVVMIGWVVWRPERLIDPASQLPAFLIPLAAVVAIGLSRVEGNLAAIGVAIAIAHAIASAVWFGGALLVARVVLAGPGDDDLVHAVRGFSRLSAPAIIVAVITGVAQMLRLVGGALFTSSHGRVMLLKAVAVAGMIFVAMSIRQVVAARLRRADQMSPQNADRFRRSFTAEAGIGVVVLALSGWLLGLTPAQVNNDISYQVNRPFVDDASGLDVLVRITPATVGLNGLRVEVESPQDGISNLRVAFLPPEGTLARGIEQPIPASGAGTWVLDQSVGIPFDVPGTWTVQLTGVTATGTITGATSTFQVSGEGAVDPTTGTDVPGTDVPATGETDPGETDPGVPGTQPPTIITIEIIETEPTG